MYKIPAVKNTKPFAFCTSKGEKGWLKSLNTFNIDEIEELDTAANNGNFKVIISLLTREEKVRKILRNLALEEMQSLLEAYLDFYRMDTKK